LECKEVRDLGGIKCIKNSETYDPNRIIRGQARIAYQPFKYLGYFNFRGLTFWVHSWVDNFKEVKIGESFLSPEELKEVAYDIGVQLGKGHVKDLGATSDFQLRFKQKKILEKYEEQIKLARQEFADSTISAWKMFKNIYYSHQ
jgi:hypothetical protein